MGCIISALLVLLMVELGASLLNHFFVGGLGGYAGESGKAAT